MFKSRTPEIEKSVKDHDEEVGFAVKEYLEKNNLDYNESDVDKIADVGSGIVRYYKNKFERPRPYQLAEAMNLDFNIKAAELLLKLEIGLREFIIESLTNSMKMINGANLKIVKGL